MRAIRKEELQPRPAARNLLNALARWFQALPFRVVDDAPPLRDLVIIKVGDPNAALRDEPLDQLLSLRPPGPRDGPLAVGLPRAGGHCRLAAATSDRRAVVDHQGPTVPQGIGRAPVTRYPGSTTLAGNEAVRLPVLAYGAERHPSAVGVPWDFSGTSGPIKRHERETAERSFAQLSDHRSLVAAGHRVHWSLLGHLTGTSHRPVGPAWVNDARGRRAGGPDQLPEAASSLRSTVSPLAGAFGLTGLL